MSAITGASRSTERFTSHVGIGSSSQVLHGTASTNRWISSRVIAAKDERTGDSRTATVGGLADAVLTRILLTLGREVLCQVTFL